MFDVHLVSLIIDPSFSCPVSTRLLYIVGSNISCLWSPSEIELRNRINDKFSEFTWFNKETCTSGKMLTAPCSKSDIESSVSILRKKRMEINDSLSLNFINYPAFILLFLLREHVTKNFGSFFILYPAKCEMWDAKIFCVCDSDIPQPACLKLRVVGWKLDKL